VTEVLIVISDFAEGDQPMPMHMEKQPK